MVTRDGHFVGVGFGKISETGAERDMVVIQVKESDGAIVAHWRSGYTGDDVATAVALTSSGNYLVAGFSRPSTGAVSKRVLLSLSPSSLNVNWKATLGEAGSHSSYEAIAYDSGRGVWLGGVKDNSNGAEFVFKSAGNIPAGTAFISFISNANLDSSAGPSAEDYLWSDANWVSVKALDRSDESGNRYVIASLHKEVAEHPKAALVKLKLASAAPFDATASTVEWGPTEYASQTESTDVAVAPDGSGYIMAGHGSTVWMTNASAPKEYYGRFTRVDTSGNFLWTVNISVGKPSIIFTECFGVQPIGWNTDKPGWVASCGSGIEGQSLCTSLVGDDRTNCENGVGDTVTPGAPKRNPEVWMANIPRLLDSKTSTPPAVLSDMLTSYVAADATPGPKGSTGGEFISLIMTDKTEGSTDLSVKGLYVTTDEEFGAGFLKLGLEPR